MSELSDYMKDQLKKGEELGSNPDIPIKDAARSVWTGVKVDYRDAFSYAQRRKHRKNSVAARLHELRTRKGLKQQDVAKQTGINVVTLSGYEIGKNEPNLEALVRLADFYHVSLDYLMCREDSPQIIQETTESNE